MTSPKKMKMDDVPGEKLQEGKTKIIYDHSESTVYVQSKDKISAHNAQMVNELEGKAAISTATTCKVFEFLELAGLKTAFVRRVNDKAFIAQKCQMIPIEWVTRRIATGSFLKRNEGVQEGYRFSPPKLELFYKDDAAGDPQWSEEQVIAKKYECNGMVIGAHEVAVMSRATVLIFEVLEKAWASLDCSLIDMKIEFGVNTKGEVVLADVIDSDSWRLWPSGDKRLMKDKQVYRNLKVVTDEALQQVKRNFQWVADKLDLIIPKPSGMAVVFMGSESDLPHCQKIKEACTNLGFHCDMRVTSAHKGTEETLEVLAHYEGLGVPLVFIAVAGRSNGLGPVLSGNATFPVINCPPLKADWGSQDVWSSLRLPSGLGCAVVMSPEAAALNAAQILGLNDHVIWSRLRVKQYNTWLGLKEADRRLQAS